MAGDLQSEIAARRQRIAELKAQRAAQVVPGYVQETAKLSLCVPDIVHVDIEEPYLYERSIPADLGKIAEPETVEKPDELVVEKLEKLDASDVEKEDEIAKTTTFTVAPPDHLSPQILTFLDDSWRAIARGDVRNFRETPRDAAQPAAPPSDLPLVGKADGSRLVAFSKFHPIVAALDQTGRKVIISNLDSGIEFTLRSPTPVTDLIFSPLLAQHISGAGRNGQVLVWDLKNMLLKGGRYDLLPQMRSPIESSKIVALRSLGTASLVTANADGVVKVWASDRLSRPVHTLGLETYFRQSPAGLKLVPTCMEILCAEYLLSLGFGWKVAVVGTLSGSIWRLPNSATGQVNNDEQAKHAGGVTCLAISDQVVDEYVNLVSGGLDWQICLWRVPLDEQLPTLFEKSFKIDYAVCSVSLHNEFMAAGGEHTLQVYRLDRTRPLITITTEYEVQQVRFNGDKLAVASSDGLFFYDTRSFFAA